MHTNVVAGRAQLETVRLVTIATGHSGMIHPALDERSVFVVLLFYLSVGEVVVFIEQCDAVIVAYRLAMHVVFVNLAAARMASSAHLDFPFRSDAASFDADCRSRDRSAMQRRRVRQARSSSHRWLSFFQSPCFFAHAT